MESMSDCIPQRIVAGGVSQLATLGAFTQNDKCQQHELQMLCWREVAKVACLFDRWRVWHRGIVGSNICGCWRERIWSYIFTTASKAVLNCTAVWLADHGVLSCLVE